LLFGMLVSRITQLTKNEVIEDGRATWLAIDGPGSLGALALRGQSPTGPAVDILFGIRLHRRALVPVGKARPGCYVGQRTADEASAARNLLIQPAKHANHCSD
jgi:hypothetical protein